MPSPEQITRTTGPLIDGLLIAHRLRRSAAARLLLCRVAANRTLRYQVKPAEIHAIPHFKCQSCHCDSPHSGALQGSANDLKRAAQTALMAFVALGHHDMSMKFALRGVCADCTTGVAA